MNVNWDTVLLALKISGIGILVLLLVLALLALIVSLLTRLIKDKPEEEENEDAGVDEETAPAITSQTSDLAKIAAIAVAIARTQSEFSSTTKSETMSLNSWGQFHLSRRLNLSSSIRRSK